MSVAAVIIYQTNFFRQVWENPKVNRFFLNLCLTCCAMMLTLLAWMSLIGPIILRREIELERDYPKLVPVMAISMVLSVIFSIMAMWPVFGFLTPIYMLALTFGGTMSMILLPGGNLGNLCFWVGLIAVGYISHTMDHDPVW